MLKPFIFTLIVSMLIVVCGTVYAGLDQHGSVLPTVFWTTP